LILDADVPAPELNGALELGAITLEADAVWRDAKVIVELDGWQSHGTRSQFALDRARDRAAVEAGWIVLRYTWADLDATAVWQIERVVSERTAPRSDPPRSAAPRA
jgi:very-short-patch-repair endonuclease